VRIVAGIYGGRRLTATVAGGTRPTSDRVREALGSALASRGAFDEAHVLDLFSGTGALGLEALSRGAKRVVCVEHDRQALQCIRNNVKALALGPELEVLDLDLDKPPAQVASRLRAQADPPFSLVFADPPYANTDKVPALLHALAEAGLLAPQALVALEHDSNAEPEIPAGFKLVNRYRYGSTSTLILAHTS
jgi:16S rRNA (guanine966-N2)-methyltransferase